MRAISVTGPQLVEQAATLGTLDKAGVEARYAVVGDHLIYGKPCRLGVSKLVFDVLLCGGYASVKDDRHDIPLVR